MKIFLFISLYISFSLLIAKDIGILILAHGGSAKWNRTVKEAVEFLKEDYHLEVLFTMGDPEAIEKKVRILEEKGVKKIVVVPLYISSYSPIVRQINYILGASKEPPKKPMVMFTKEEIEKIKPFIDLLKEKLPSNLSWWIWERKPKPFVLEAVLDEYEVYEEREKIMQSYLYYLSLYRKKVERIKPIKSNAEIIVTSPLDDHPVVISIVCDRILELSENPERETVILVAHGPNSEEDNVKWLLTMERIGKECDKKVKSLRGTSFRNVLSVTVRDDAPEPIYNQAKEHLRALVRQAGASGDVIVIPLLLARGGIEEGIVKRLEGLDYKWNGKTLLPHEGIRKFVETSIKEAIKWKRGN